MNKFALALTVVAYLLVGTLYAIKTPDWQAPDEPAHYNYIRQLADGRLPVLEMGDYDQAYLGQLTTHRFPPQLSVESLEYEDWQPPLYYLLATPLYLAFDGALLPLRLFSVLLGAGVVWLAYTVAVTVFPDRPLIALGAAAWVAFLPQHVAMMAGVNNDSLTELLIGLTLVLALRWVESDEGPPKRGETEDGRQRTKDGKLMGMGVIVGLGLVTKASFAPIALVVAAAMIADWRRGGKRERPLAPARSAGGELARRLALVFGPALLIAAPWWLRNVATYSGLDFYGTINHDAVVVGQPRTGWWIQTYGLRAWLERWVTFTFQSFWGQFGWMGVLMPTWLYRALALWSGALLVGFLLWLRNATRNLLLGVLGLTVLLVLLVYGYYNVTFVQHQGRYLFPALIPIALGAALATDALLRLMRLPERLRPLAFVLPYLAMIALDLYALWRFILPALT